MRWKHMEMSFRTDNMQKKCIDEGDFYFPVDIFLVSKSVFGHTTVLFGNRRGEENKNFIRTWYESGTSQVCVKQDRSKFYI